MKLSKITNRGIESSGYWNLILENMSDLELYVQYDGKQVSECVMKLWTKLKEGDGKSSPYSHVHYKSHPIAQLMAFHLTHPKSKDGQTSVVEYFTKADSIIEGKYSNMAKMLKLGKSVRTNHVGGYSELIDSFVSIEDLDCDEARLVSYLLTGDADVNNERFTKHIDDFFNDNLLPEIV